MTDLKAEDVTTRARKGAAWSLVIAAAAFPLTMLRNYFLVGIDGTGDLRGTYELLLLFLNAIYTFLFPGGRNIFPAYYPKLRSADERSRFVSGFVYLVLAASAIGVAATIVWPGLFDFALQQPVDRATGNILRCLIPFALLSALANSIVTGHMSFVWASFLLRAQLVLVTAVAGVMFVTRSRLLTDHAMLWLSGTVAAAAAANMIVSTSILFRTVRLRRRVLFPPGCFKFSALTYLDTVMLWFYMAIDRVFIIAAAGTTELGVYAVLFDVARIIPLAVQQLGHLLLTTFSKLLGSDAEDALARSYLRVSRLTIGFYAAVSVFVVLFSRPIAGLFGFADKHDYLILLAVVMNIDSLRTINGMTLMAYERMPAVFFSKLFQNVVQLGVTVALVMVWPMGIYGVIIGKGAGHVVSAVVLIVATARVGRTRRLLPPWIYLTGQGIVTAAAVVAYAYADRAYWESGVGVVIGWVVIWFGGGLTADDLRAMFPWRRGGGGGRA